jgi:hypothetical protein
MRQVMPHRNNIVADPDNCKSFLRKNADSLIVWANIRSALRLAGAPAPASRSIMGAIVPSAGDAASGAEPHFSDVGWTDSAATTRS